VKPVSLFKILIRANSPASSHPLHVTAATLAAYTTERIIQRRLGYSADYPYEKKSVAELFKNFRTALYEFGNAWRLRWNLPRHFASKFAYLIENAMEELFTLRDVPLYSALLSEEWLGRLRNSGFRDEIPTDEDLTDFRETMKKRSFTVRKWARTLRKLSTSEPYADIDKTNVRTAWVFLLDSLSVTLIYVFSDRFRRTKSTLSSSKISLQAESAGEVLFAAIQTLADAINDSEIVEASGSSSIQESIDTDIDL
jgi:hypothetical protein